MQVDGPKTSSPFVKTPRVLSNFWHLICDNFCYIFRKIAKLYFLEASLWSLKTRRQFCKFPEYQCNALTEMHNFALIIVANW